MKTIILSLIALTLPTWGQGLKKVDFKNQTTDSQSTQTPSLQGEASITPEQMKELQENISKLKKNQEEQRKFLEQLDNEDN